MPAPATWCLINIDKRQISQEAVGDLGDWFFNDHKGLYRSLCVPIVSWEIDEWCANPSPQPQALLFSILPTELLGLIFGRLSLQHAATLAITCRLALNIGRFYVGRRASIYFAPWAGTRLLAASVFMDGTLPEGLLTQREKTELKRGASYSRSPSPMFRAFTPRELSLGEFADEYYTPVFGAQGVQEVGDSPEKTVLGAIITGDPGSTAVPDPHNTLNDDDEALLRALCSPGRWRVTATNTEDSGPRVLANLSQCVYVREDRMRVARERARAQVRVAWGHILLARIGWAKTTPHGRKAPTGLRGFDGRDPPTWVSVGSGRGWGPQADMLGDGAQGGRGRYEYSLHRGQWAGDRFAIVPLERMWEVDLDWEMSWRDVSEEVDAEVRLIWEMQGGVPSRQGTPIPVYMPWEVFPSCGSLLQDRRIGEDDSRISL